MTRTTAQNAPIRILDVSPLVEAGPVLALLRVEVGLIVFHQCRLISESPDSPLYVTPPMLRYRKPDGSRRYQSLVEWAKPVRDAVNRAARAAWAKQYAQEGIHE